jgi:DNA-binding CsgD family transcriptional regulator
MGEKQALQLTPREFEVVELVVRGYSNEEIARRLFLSRQTVKTHLRRIFRKCGVDSRVQLVAQWIRRERDKPVSVDSRTLGSARPRARLSLWRAPVLAGGALTAIAGLFIAWLLLSGFGVLDRQNTGALTEAANCEVGDTLVLWSPVVDEQPVTLPDGTTSIYQRLGEAKLLVLPGYSAVMETVGEDESGLPIYGCPARYQLDEAQLEQLTAH